jgi:acid phosphatase
MNATLTRVLLLLSLLASTAHGESDIGFLAFGDWGMGNAGQKQAAAGMKTFCHAQPCKFGVILGDNFYPSGVKNVDDPQWGTKFESMYGVLGIPFYVSLGNHDYRGNVQAQIDYSGKSPRWICPARYHTFTEGDLQFFAIDTNQFNQAERDWLEAQLAASTAKWKIVFGHHPIYSGGGHGDTAELKKDLLPLLKKAKVDFYLSGHDHDSEVIEADGGVNFVVSGNAAEAKAVKGGPHSKFAQSRLGFAYLRAQGDRMTLKMVKSDGATVDLANVYTRSSP